MPYRCAPHLQAAAVLMLGLWLSVVLAALLPHLHEALHQDSHSAKHECFVTQFSKSQILAGQDASVGVEARPIGLVVIFSASEKFVSSADYGWSSSRAPPAAFVPSRVVG